MKFPEDLPINGVKEEAENLLSPFTTIVSHLPVRCSGRAPHWEKGRKADRVLTGKLRAGPTLGCRAAEAFRVCWLQAFVWYLNLKNKQRIHKSFPWLKSSCVCIWSWVTQGLTLLWELGEWCFCLSSGTTRAPLRPCDWVSCSIKWVSCASVRETGTRYPACFPLHFSCQEAQVKFKAVFKEFCRTLGLMSWCYFSSWFWPSVLLFSLILALYCFSYLIIYCTLSFLYFTCNPFV